MVSGDLDRTTETEPSEPFLHEALPTVGARVHVPDFRPSFAEIVKL